MSITLTLPSLRFGNRAFLPYIDGWLQNLLTFLCFSTFRPLTHSDHCDSKLLCSSPVASNRLVGQESLSMAHSRRAGHLVGRSSDRWGQERV